MEYKIKNGRKVILSGWVVINNVNHLVKNGFVVCNPLLNQRSWNITDKKHICYECSKHVEIKQLSIF